MMINTHTSHPSVFISSTFLDLECERKTIANILRESNIQVNALDVRPASNESSRREIMQGIRESDFIILIIGERYGSIIPRITKTPTLSVTHWEYHIAVNKFKKDALVYFKKEIDTNNSKNLDDRNSNDYKAKQEYLRKFKEHLSITHNPKYFTTVKELADEVKNALTPTYRSGIKSLLKTNNLLSCEIEALKKEVQTLNSRILSTQNTNYNLSPPSPQRALGVLPLLAGTNAAR